jgi:hypothetical protein
MFEKSLANQKPAFVPGRIAASATSSLKATVADKCARIVAWHAPPSTRLIG